jgi:energy-coupling factor transport system substrate-specific component
MSWQLASFTILALALAGGFAWYERVRPDARIVALVGTLAAFAALGRIAFAAVPNVKPTTDIVLISGYALGGGPGFAVGALAGLTSNFFFGQGPWTPWQMAAWGATGIVGAALARATSPGVRARLARRRAGGAPSGQPWIGRWPLAVVCCAVGFAFTVIQDVGDWVTYSDHSVAQLGLYVGQGLGFDAIHAAGCLLFALALGPVLIRSIQRLARRLQVRWLSPRAIAPVVAVAGALLPGLHAPPGARAAGEVSGPASYLLGAQNADGGFGAARGQASNALYTGWAALGLASAGYDLQRVARGPRGVMAYIRASRDSLSDVGSIERTMLVVSAARLSTRSFGGRDLVAMLSHRVGRNGSVSGQVNLTAFAVLAMRGTGARVAPRTVSWLAGQQNRDGGFGFAAGAASDVDDTGAVLEALAGDRGARPARARRAAVAYLRRRQNRDGGFPSQPGGESNAQSTAWAIQGLDAAGVAPAALHRAGSGSPIAYLRGLIARDGSVDYSRGTRQTPVWVTGEALMALEGKPLPLAPPRAGKALAEDRSHAGKASARRRARAAYASTPGRARAGSASTPGRARASRRRFRSASEAGRRRARTTPRSRGADRRARRAAHPRAHRAPNGVAGLARDAGIATALLLAPVGLG